MDPYWWKINLEWSEKWEGNSSLAPNGTKFTGEISHEQMNPSGNDDVPSYLLPRSLI